MCSSDFSPSSVGIGIDLVPDIPMKFPLEEIILLDIMDSVDKNSMNPKSSSTNDLINCPFFKSYNKYGPSEVRASSTDPSLLPCN